MRKIYIDDEGMIFEGEFAEFIEELEDGLEAMEKDLDKRRKELEELNSKGDDKMKTKFKGKVKVTTYDLEKGTIKQKARVVKEIVKGSVKNTLSNPMTYVAGGSVGLQSGLKYKGDLKHGSKAGLATVAVLAGIDVAANIIHNMDLIKEA